MTPLRRVLTFCGLAFFIAAVAGYIFWIPYDPAGLYRAIPANATLVSAHQNLAQRWPQLATNIWLAPFLGATSTADQTRAPRMNLAATQLIRLARRDTLCAYLPAPGGNAQSVWMAAAWIGGWSPCVRWALVWGRWHGIKDLGSFGGRTMWGLQQPLADGQRLSFACGDGILLACLSPDPSAVRYALMAYDGLIPSTRAFAELQAMPKPVSPDVFWGQWLGPANNERFTLTGELARFDDRGLAADIRIRPSPLRQAQLAESIEITAVEQTLGNLPVLIMALPFATILDKLPATTPNAAWLETADRILQSDWIRPDDNGLVLALFTGEYGGGYGRKPLRMRIPALMAFTRIKHPDGIQRAIRRELDLLNARHRLGLIQDPMPLNVGAQALWTIEITSNQLLSEMEIEDRPAYTLVGDWLIVSSQAGSLAKLMQRIQKLDDTTPLPPAGWHATMSAKNTSGVAWLDLDAGGKTIQLALSLWGLSQRTSERPSTPPAIKTLRILLDRTCPLQSCTLWMEPEGSNALVHLQIGPRPEP